MHLMQNHRDRVTCSSPSRAERSLQAILPRKWNPCFTQQGMLCPREQAPSEEAGRWEPGCVPAPPGRLRGSDFPWKTCEKVGKVKYLFWRGFEIRDGKGKIPWGVVG